MSCERVGVLWEGLWSGVSRGSGFWRGKGVRIACILFQRFGSAVLKERGRLCQEESSWPTGKGRLTVKHQDLELPRAGGARRVNRPSRGICRNRDLLAIRILPHDGRGSGGLIMGWFPSRVMRVIQQIASRSGLAGESDQRAVADES